MSRPSEPDFPVDGTYRIRASMRPLGGRRGGLEPHFLDEPSRRTSVLTARLDALERGAWSCRVHDLRRPEATGALWHTAARTAARDVPERVVLHGAHDVELPVLALAITVDWARMEAGPPRRLDTVPKVDAGLAERARAWLAAQSSRDRMMDLLALALEEDLVVIAGPENGGADRAELLHVALASGWSAVDKLGLDFAQIHGPVPENHALLDAHAGLVRTFIERGPFVREVWGLHADDALCHDPHLHGRTPDPDPMTPESVAAQTWFRTERQTLLGLPSVNRALFSIRVANRPLADVVSTPERAARLAASLRDMSEAIARYKGMERRGPHLLAWLDARAAAGGEHGPADREHLSEGPASAASPQGTPSPRE